MLGPRRVLLRSGEGSGRVAYDCLRTTVGKMLDASLVLAGGAADDGLVSLRGTVISWMDTGANVVGAALGVGICGGTIGVGIGTVGGCG